MGSCIRSPRWVSLRYTLISTQLNASRETSDDLLRSLCMSMPLYSSELFPQSRESLSLFLSSTFYCCILKTLSKATDVIVGLKSFVSHISGITLSLSVEEFLGSCFIYFVLFAFFNYHFNYFNCLHTGRAL